MARQEGEVTPPQAAMMLKLDPTTIRRWIQSAVDGAPSRIPIEAIRKDIVGRYYLRRSMVREISENCDQICKIRAL